jgi:hypothetical protein
MMQSQRLISRLMSIKSAPVSSTALNPPRWHEKHLRLAIEAAGVALWSWNVENDKLTMDEHGYSSE